MTQLLQYSIIIKFMSWDQKKGYRNSFRSLTVSRCKLCWFFVFGNQRHNSTHNRNHWADDVEMKGRTKSKYMTLVYRVPASNLLLCVLSVLLVVQHDLGRLFTGVWMRLTWHSSSIFISCNGALRWIVFEDKFIKYQTQLSTVLWNILFEFLLVTAPSVYE